MTLVAMLQKERENYILRIAIRSSILLYFGNNNVWKSNACGNHVQEVLLGERPVGQFTTGMDTLIPTGTPGPQSTLCKATWCITQR